jgi:AmiR/NasT family two-component response regulator
MTKMPNVTGCISPLDGQTFVDLRQPQTLMPRKPLLLEGLLQAEGSDVISAETGTEAQTLLMSEEPDVALLDIRMPGLDGVSILRGARKGGFATPLIRKCRCRCARERSA